MEDQDRATVRIGYEDPANFPEELFEEICKKIDKETMEIMEMNDQQSSFDIEV